MQKAAHRKCSHTKHTQIKVLAPATLPGVTAVVASHAIDWCGQLVHSVQELSQHVGPSVWPLSLPDVCRVCPGPGVWL